MNTIKLLALVIISVVAISDQISKYYILSLFEDSTHSIDVLSFFKLTLVYNEGVSFGMFNNLSYGRAILTLMACIITAFVTYWLFTAKEKGVILALSLIIGGAIGNIIDRIRLGHVVDFLDFYIGSYHWPAFNIADSAIFIGVAYLCIEQLFFHRKGATT